MDCGQTLIVFGLFLAVADAVGSQERDLTRLRYKHGILYGLAQAMALIPGVSRSGGTITAGLLMGYTREAAARYSFLLAIPAVFGSGLYQLYKVVAKEGITGPTGSLRPPWPPLSRLWWATSSSAGS
ncbi:undecaprenyl-diphosphatase [Arthrobacter sp. Hiyo6]|nr:undecaprenyl-diphosphatase [Arthrobacter sp. Hiyo6]